MTPGTGASAVGLDSVDFPSAGGAAVRPCLMTSTSEPAAVSPDLQAVLGARRELGPDYDRALVDGFVERAERHLLARAAVRDAPAVQKPATAEVGAGGLALALATIAWGLLSTFLGVVGGSGREPLLGLAIVAGWGALGLCDLGYLSMALDRALRRRR